MRIEFTVNGLPRALDVPPLRRLLDVLREDLGLTGTKEGCGEGECGACAVLLDGSLVQACLVPAIQLQGVEIITIEGLGTKDRPDPVQTAFLEEGAVQCGFCIPGMVLASRHLLNRTPDPTRHQIRTALAGNLCRCTGYERIVRAVERAAAVEREAGRQAAPRPGIGPGAVPVGVPGNDPGNGARVAVPAAALRDGSQPPSSAYSPHLRHVLRLLAEKTPAARLVAGGTDLMTDLHLSDTQPVQPRDSAGSGDPGGARESSDFTEPRETREPVDLTRIPELIGIRVSQRGIEIGSATTVAQILEDARIAEILPALNQAAACFGARAIRERATVGGNLVSASPAGDLAPPLLVLDAEVLLAGPGGARAVPLASFFSGYRTTACAPGELLLGLRIPLPEPGTRQAFEKVGTRRAQSIAKVSLAACVRIDTSGVLRHVRFAAGSVAATPILLRAAQDMAEGQGLAPDLPDRVGSAAAAEVAPIDDVRSTAEYRRVILGRLVRRFLRLTTQHWNHNASGDRPGVSP